MQTVVITTIAAFIIFVLGLVLNYSLKDHDKAENRIINQARCDEMTKNQVVDRFKISARTQAVSVTVASSTLLLDNSSNGKIICLVLTGILFTGFYVMIIFYLKGRQTRLHKQTLLVYNKELENGIQNIPTNIQGNKNGWAKLPESMV